MFDDKHNLNSRGLPLYLKGKEILELTAKIVELIPEENEALMHLKALMLEDAALLTVKVSGAEAGDLFDIRMECATLIRKAARELVSHCTTLTMFGFPETQYLHLIREAIEEYRELFICWVHGFDRWNYVKDRWGLFNPPGIHPEGTEDEDGDL